MAFSSYTPGRFWSHTLGKDLEACERRVYYRIWGALGGWSPDGPPLARLLYTAKTSRDLKAYAGTKVHSAAQHAIQRIRAQIKIPPKQVWLDAFDELMSKEISFSAEGKWRTLRNPKKAVLILREHFVGADLHDWVIEESIERAKAAFSSFYDVYLPQIRVLPVGRIILIDSLDKRKFEGFDLFLSPDLVLLDDEVTQIIDWKTGIGTNSEQLVAYAWYFEEFAKRRGLPSKPMEGRSIPLLDPEKELRVQISDELLASAETRIRADLEHLKDLALRAPGGDLAFPKARDLSACEWCSFNFHCSLRPDADADTGREDAKK